jgi:hypothetical protein
MKRFALLLGALALSIQAAGCGGSSGSATTVPRSEDPNLPAEVREFEAKDAQRVADRAAKKAAKAGSRAAGRR